MWNKIIDPISKKQYSINSREGDYLLKQYIIHGGSNEPIQVYVTSPDAKTYHFEMLPNETVSQLERKLRSLEGHLHFLLYSEMGLVNRYVDQDTRIGDVWGKLGVQDRVLQLEMVATSYSRPEEGDHQDESKQQWDGLEPIRVVVWAANQDIPLIYEMNPNTTLKDLEERLQKETGYTHFQLYNEEGTLSNLSLYNHNRLITIGRLWTHLGKPERQLDLFLEQVDVPRPEEILPPPPQIMGLSRTDRIGTEIRNRHRQLWETYQKRKHESGKVWNKD